MRRGHFLIAILLTLGLPLVQGSMSARAAVTQGTAGTICTSDGTNWTCTWNTHGSYAWTVPNGLTSVSVDVRGASGGVGSGGGGPGGPGGDVQGALSVTPGTVLTLQVGGAGGDALAISYGQGGHAGAAGYGGGGSGAGWSNVQGASFGGGGGGASLIATSASSPVDLVVGAGGGGGSGQTYFGYGWGGGPGGFPSGAPGMSAAASPKFAGDCHWGAGGGGGTQSAGGAGGAGGADAGYSCPDARLNGNAGRAGAGGNAADFYIGAGGGGGGYYGGGAGGAGEQTGAGGGGSSYADASLTNAAFSTLNQSGDGSITITYPCIVSHTTVMSSANPSTYESPVTFTATVDQPNAAGTMQFQVDGANLGSPAPITGGVATSTTAILGVGNHTITAIYSGDPTGRATASSGTVNQTVTAAASNLATTSWTTPGTYSWTVPNGVNWVVADARGASGGNGSGQSGWGSGGRGGDAQATVHVTPGQVLTVRVGGAGGNAATQTAQTYPAATAGAGGYGGGGDGGGLAGIYPANFGGGGGGASLIATTDSTRVSLLIGAGGGGGSSGLLRQVYSNGPPSGLPGGDAGYPAGSQGSGNSNQGAAGGGGGGGTQTAGGSGGAAGYQAGKGGNGSLDTGGAGSSSSQSGGGGGGGGYYGGGGGGGGSGYVGGGGGGGSSHADERLTDAKFSTSSHSGNGAVSFSYTPALAATALTVSSASGTYGGATSLSATLTSGGTGVGGKTITFSLNGNAMCGSSGQLACPSTDVNGLATLPGVSLSGLSTGTYPSSGTPCNATTPADGVFASFGGDSANAASSGCNTLTVSQANQATVTVTAPSTGTYGQTYPLSSSGGSGTGAVTYDAGTSTACSVSGNQLTITSGTGSCTVTAIKSEDTNYASATSASTLVTVNKATLTITPSHDAISYGDPAPTSGWGYTPSGFVGSDNATNTTITGSPSGCTTAYVQGNPPGSSYAITCTDTSGMFAANYTFTSANGALTVATRAITVTAADAGYTYGNAPPSSYTASVTARTLAGSDSLSGLGVTCSPVDSSNVPFTPTATTAAGQYSIVCSGGTTTNYSYTYGSGTLTVAPRPITVTAGSPASQTYGNTSTSTVNCTSSGFLTGDSFSTNPTGAVYDQAGTTQVTITSSSNVGAYTTECSGGTVSSNYTIQSYVPGTFTISPAELSITASSGSMTYGGAVPTITPQYSGFVNSDTGTSLTTAPTCGTAATSSSGGGQYTSSCSGAASANYTISYKNGSVTVKPAALAVTAPSLSMTYGDTTLPSLAPTVAGLKNNDAFDGIGGRCSALTNGSTPTAFTLTSSTPAGTYTVRCSGVASGNYTVTYTDGTLTVNKALLTITASSGTMAYGGTLPSITPQYSTFAGTDTTASLATPPSCSTTATSSSTVGRYASTCSGAVDGNYSITYVPGSVQVNPAVLTVIAPNASVQYSDPLPSLAPTISGYALNQGPSVVTTAPTCTSAAPTGPFTNAAGTTTTTGVTSPVGSYAISCSGGSATNYTFDYTPGILTVNREDATVQVSASSSAQILGTGPIVLTATVRDSAANGYAGANPESSTGATVGDVTKMFVEFDIYSAASCLTGTPAMSSVVSVTSSTRGVGTATYSLPSPSSDASYCVVPRVVAGLATTGTANGYGINGSNSYYTAAAGSVTGIAFYTNTGQLATGGGWIADSSSNVQGALSFNARYTKAGGAKGQMAYSWRAMYNGVPATYTITSNAITSLTFGSSGSTLTATLQGKCAESIVAVGTGQILFSSSNLTFTATAKDGDYGLSQNVPSDAFSLSVFNSSNQSVKQFTATPLGGGNLVIHNS